MIELLDAVNRLIDIINARGYKNGKHLKVWHINSTAHPHIFEMFSILRLFEEWKQEVGLTDRFITRQTYEDLVWMVFGLAGIACVYLDTDGNKKMHQGRSGTDVCEHFFAMIRSINSNPNLQQCREGASKVSSSIKSNLFTGTKGGQNTAGTKREHDDFFNPLHKKRKID